MSNYRMERVQQEILRSVNEILMREVKDPRVEGITITEVDLTGDLSQATIYYSSLDDLASQRQKIQDGLDNATGLIRSELGKRLTVYKVPELIFERDPSVDYGHRIEDLLQQIKDKDA